jgi:hypothetical protein
MLKSWLACGLVLAAGSSGAVAADVPDMTGTWLLKAEGVKLQKNQGEATHNVDHFAAETMSYAVDFTVTVEAQDGVTFFGKKASAIAEEEIAGVIDFDNTQVWMIDFDGTTTCILTSPDEMTCVYQEINAENSNLNRQRWTRQP